MIDRLVGRNAKHTNHVSAGHQWHGRKAVKSGTAQVFGDRFERLPGIDSEKAHRPVNLRPRPPASFLPACGQGSPGFQSFEFGGERLQRMSEHKLFFRFKHFRCHRDQLDVVTKNVLSLQ